MTPQIGNQVHISVGVETPRLGCGRHNNLNKQVIRIAELNMGRLGLSNLLSTTKPYSIQGLKDGVEVCCCHFT